MAKTATATAIERPSLNVAIPAARPTTRLKIVHPQVGPAAEPTAPLPQSLSSPPTAAAIASSANRTRLYTSRPTTSSQRNLDAVADLCPSLPAMTLHSVRCRVSTCLP